MTPEQKARHMALVAARTADPATLKQAATRSDAIAARMPNVALAALGDKMMAEKTVARRTIWLNLAADVLARAADASGVPCRPTCSHCCNMATIISTFEASRIAAASGRAMAQVPDAVFRQDDEIDRIKYNGVPCPMLKDDRCTVYEVRPFACRKHYSVDADNLLCKIVPGEEIRAPMYNASVLDQLWVYAHAGADLQDGIQLADIRDFFPAEKA